MRTTRAMMFAVIGAFLAYGLAPAGAATEKSAEQQARTSVRAHSAAAARAQADGVFYAGKVGKSCTYRGGPKTGNWDCR